jgi:hypothetical protein
MKESSTGAGAPTNAYIYTVNDIKKYHCHSPLLVDRLGWPHHKGENRLILSYPLFDGADDPPLPPQLPTDGLPLFDWPLPLSLPDNKTRNSGSGEGVNDAVRH